MLAEPKVQGSAFLFKHLFLPRFFFELLRGPLHFFLQKFLIPPVLFFWKRRISEFGSEGRDEGIGEEEARRASNDTSSLETLEASILYFDSLFVKFRKGKRHSNGHTDDAIALAERACLIEALNGRSA